MKIGRTPAIHNQFPKLLNLPKFVSIPTSITLTLIMALAIQFPSKCLANPAPISSEGKNESELRKKCESKKDASACFAIGFIELNKNDPSDRKAASRHFKMGCAVQKKKANCTKPEIKLAARKYHGKFLNSNSSNNSATVLAKSNSDATNSKLNKTGKAPIRAPRIPTSTGSSRSSAPFTPSQHSYDPAPQMQAPEPMSQPAAYIPPPPPEPMAPPMPYIPPQPPQQLYQPAPPMPMPGEVAVPEVSR